MRRRERSEGQRGFTLIELLVVISVIVLLMALLLPALARARDQARDIVCRTRLRQWGTLMDVYLEDNEGRFPPATDVAPGVSILRELLLDSQPGSDVSAPSSRVSSKGIAFCPMATRTTNEWPYTWHFDPEKQIRAEANGGDTFAAWEITFPPPSIRGSYGLNLNIFWGALHDWRVPDGVLMGGDHLNVFSLRGRAKMPFAFDSSFPSSGLVYASNSPPDTQWLGMGLGIFVQRHGERVNMVFLDGAVRPVGLKEVWTLKWQREFDTAGPWTKAGRVPPDAWPEWMRKFKDY